VNIIASQLSRHVEISNRLRDVVLWYLISLMVKAPKHSLSFASQLSGLHKSQFSRLLSKSREIALSNLDKLIRIVTLDFLSSRDPILPGAPWSVAIVIDATIQKRSSRKARNAQIFNHGKGYVVGHQWTNIILIINGITIPLKPIKFLTKSERTARRLKKETEHECVIRYLEMLNLISIIGHNKKIQSTIIDKGWDFICSLKCSRSVKTKYEEKNGYLSRRVDNIFWACRKRAPWQTVRDHVNSWKGKKRKEFRARELLGYLSGVKHCVKLVFSEERGRRKGRKYMACSNINVHLGLVVRVYRKRWAVELFHKDVKSSLGFEDVSCHDFASVEAHVYWVYCAYMLMRILFPNHSSLTDCMDKIEAEIAKQPFLEIRQRLTRFNGNESAKLYCSQVIESNLAA
jgi:hypothetical protein